MVFRHHKSHTCEPPSIEKRRMDVNISRDPCAKEKFECFCWCQLRATAVVQYMPHIISNSTNRLDVNKKTTRVFFFVALLGHRSGGDCKVWYLGLSFHFSWRHGWRRIFPLWM